MSKTGSSMGNVLLRTVCNNSIGILPTGYFGNDIVSSIPKKFGCDRKLCLHGTHTPVPASTRASELSRYVTMVRAPVNRAYSHQQYNGPKKLRATLCKYLKETHSFSFQTKMVLGYGYKAPIKLKKADATFACLKIAQFAFVGITEQWSASVCLLHHTIGGSTRSSDLFNNRPGKQKSDSSKQLQIQNAQEKCPDEVDEILFHCALDLFLERLRKTHCFALLQFTDLGTSRSNEMLNRSMHTQ